MGRIHDSILGHAISQRQEKDLVLQNETETTLASLVCKVGRYLAENIAIQSVYLDFQICRYEISLRIKLLDPLAVFQQEVNYTAVFDISLVFIFAFQHRSLKVQFLCISLLSLLCFKKKTKLYSKQINYEFLKWTSRFAR